MVPIQVAGKLRTGERVDADLRAHLLKVHTKLWVGANVFPVLGRKVLQIGLECLEVLLQLSL